MWKICPCALTGWKTRAPHPDKPNCHGSPTRGHIRYSQVRSSGCWSSKEFSKLLVTREKSFPIHGEYLTRSLGRLFHPCRFANNCYLRIFIEHELNDRGILFLIPRAFASAWTRENACGRKIRDVPKWSDYWDDDRLPLSSSIFSRLMVSYSRPLLVCDTCLEQLPSQRSFHYGCRVLLWSRPISSKASRVDVLKELCMWS